MEISDRVRKALIFVWNIYSPLLLYFLVSIAAEGIAFAAGIPITGERVLVFTMVSAAAAAVPLWILYRRSGLEDIRPAALGWKDATFVILSGFAFCVLVNNLIGITGWSTEEYEQTASLIYSPSLWLQLPAVGIIIPVTEELVFRGLGFGRMRREIPFLPAAVISALFFGWFHGNLVQGVYGFCLGLVLAWLYERYQMIAAPVLFHMAANLLSVILTNLPFLERFSFSMTGWLFETAVAAAAVIYLWRKMREGVT